MTLTTYTTIFQELNGSSNEPIDVKIEYGADFTGDGKNDIKITLALNSASQSGTEDIIGFAFDIQNDAVSDLGIVQLTTALTPGATSYLSPTTPLTGIAANNVGSGYIYDFNLSTNGGNALSPYDVGIKLNDQGLGDGQVQSATFVLTSLSGVNDLDAEALLENTDWWIRLQSTDGGANSAKTGGHIGDLSSPVTFIPIPQIAIDKVTVDGTTEGDELNILSGESISWKYTVTNTGNVAFSNVTLTDTPAGAVTNFTGDTNSDGKLDTGEIWVYTLAGTAVTGNYSNTGTVSGSYNGTIVTASDSSSYFGVNPQIAIDQVIVNGTTEGDELNILSGESISWKYTVTNTGNVELSNVTLIDTPIGAVTSFTGDTDNDGNLDTGETWVYTLAGTAVTGDYGNTGTVSGSYTDDGGHTGITTASDSSSYFGANPQIAIDKVTVDGTTEGDGLNILSGESISWKYTVTNTGNVELSNVTLIDTPAGAVTSFTGDTDNDGNLDTGETWGYTLAGTAVTGDYSNIGTVSGSYTDSAGNTGTTTASDSSSYFGANPQIAIDQVTTTNGQTGDGLQNVPLGSAVISTYTVTNTGNVGLSNITVTTSNVGLFNITFTDAQGEIPVLDANLSTGEEDGILDLNDTWVYTTTGTVTEYGSYSNIGTASGSYTDSAGHTGTATASDGSSYSTERGLGKTPGFWKQTQHFQYWPNVDADATADQNDSFSQTFFGTDQPGDNFSYGGTTWFKDTLLGALDASDKTGAGATTLVNANGNVSALGRAATAGLLNALSDEQNTNVKGVFINYIIDSSALLATGSVGGNQTKLNAILATLDIVDGIVNGISDNRISSQEVIYAVRDAFNTNASTTLFNGAAGVNSLATALDAMNNMAGG